MIGQDYQALERGKQLLIAALRSAFVQQGYYVGADFENEAKALSLRQLAIEIALAKAGI